MKIGEHIGKNVTYYEKYFNQTYSGYAYNVVYFLLILTIPKDNYEIRKIII